MRTLRKWIGWLLALFVVAGTLVVLNFMIFNKVSDVDTVYIAKSNIDSDSPLSKDLFVKQSVPRSQIPPDAVRSERALDELKGKYTRQSILEGQTLVERMVSNSTSIRDVTQAAGDQYVAIAVPLDTQDIPMNVVKKGDTISLIGVTKETDSDEVIASFAARYMRVLEAIDDSRSGRPKLIVLASEEQAMEVAKMIRIGKYSVTIDPPPRKS